VVRSQEQLRGIPGRGSEDPRVREALEDLTNRRVNVNIVEIGRPDLDAQLAAEGIAEQLKRRASFRRAIKQRAEAILQAGAKGVKIEVAGRLGGAEMSRRIKQLMGSIPLHTLDADVDYGFAPSITTYGALGVKVWIYRGMYGESVSPDQARQGPPGRAGRSRRRARTSGPRERSRAGARASAAAKASPAPAPAEQKAAEQKPAEQAGSEDAPLPEQPPAEPATGQE